MRTLVGVGVGPGDPELVTVKGVRVLRGADVVFVPVLPENTSPGGGGVGRAEATVRVYVDADRIRRVTFTLEKDAWDTAAEAVAAAFEAGSETVAFATIGDPQVYSTFGYLAESVRARVPGVTVRSVPGVTAMQDLASRSGTVLCEGTESLALLPLTAGLDAFDEALTHFGTVVAYKGGRNLPAVLDRLRAHDRLDQAVYGSALGLPDERVCPAGELPREPGPYLSTLIVPPERGRT